MQQLLYVGIGLLGGIFGGMLGLGGGIIIVPALVYLFGFTQHQAQGTNLAVMLPPITILAMLRYYQGGNVKLGVAAFICLGFLIGGFFGAAFAQNVADTLLRKIFGVFLLIVSLRMIIFK